jgi:type IV pilus assembly protein PilA
LLCRYWLADFRRHRYENEPFFPTARAPERSFMNKKQTGFTLIELMIVVAIVGILSSIAIPAYQDFTIRSKVTEMINGAGVCKTSVQEYYNAQGLFPKALSAGCSNAGTVNAAAPTVADDTGLITVAAAGKLNTQLVGNGSGTVLTFTPTIVGASITGWGCKVGTTVSAKYLPASCR